MGIRTWLFGRSNKSQGNNELVLISLRESNAELGKLLQLSQEHANNLLKRIEALEGVLLNVRGINLEAENDTPSQPTPIELRVLELFESMDKITCSDVCRALNYSLRQVGSKRLTNMVQRGLLKRVGAGRYISYVLPS